MVRKVQRGSCLCGELEFKIRITTSFSEEIRSESEKTIRILFFFLFFYKHQWICVWFVWMLNVAFLRDALSDLLCFFLCSSNCATEFLTTVTLTIHNCTHLSHLDLYMLPVSLTWTTWMTGNVLKINNKQKCFFKNRMRKDRLVTALVRHVSQISDWQKHTFIILETRSF